MMLSASNFKLITLTKHSALKNYVDNTYCYLRTCRENYKHLIQVFGYSTKYQQKSNNKLSVDPRVEALREKLIYCDHLDHNKIKAGYLKRLLVRKAIENTERKLRNDQLMNPVYSVLLDTKNSKNDDNLVQEDGHKEYTDSKQSIKPVHMPYASIDQYSVEPSVTSSSHNNFDENIIQLNNKYKILYDKFLEAKNVASSKGKDLNLEEYLEKVEGRKSSYKSASNVPLNWMVDFEEYDDMSNNNKWLDRYGTADPNSKVSSVPCGGCGALLHCKDHALPGYLPSELFGKKKECELRVMFCQRCHFLKYYNTMLEVKVSAEEYPELLKVIKTKKCAVILMVDLTDFPCSVWPEITSVLHPMTAVFVVGNKVDLLPQDSPYFFNHVKNCLSTAIENVGIKKEKIKHVALVSAKTGYGIEELINKLHSLWKYKGDVYVIGCTNVGKSSLYNILLQSDYCKVQAADLIQRATTSPWPGTTLRLLKFPILNPVRWRLYLRTMRLISERQQRQFEEKVNVEQFKESRNLQYATLQGHIGKTFQSKSKNVPETDPFLETKYNKCETQKFGFDENEEEYKYSRWCYDTPGTIQPDQVLDLLTTDELLSVLPKSIICPRTFILRANQTIFLAGIGRLDYLQGDDFIRCTIFSSCELPVTLTLTTDAESVYDELLKTQAFVVPENNPERLKHWPALGSKEMEVTGIGVNESVVDIVLSSAGWIAIAAKKNNCVSLRAWSPQGRGLHLRKPALLKHSVALRGARILDAPTYKSGRQAYKK